MNPDFLEVIRAWNLSASYHIQTLMAQYPTLLRFGWSQPEIVMALEMGYNLDNHVALAEGHSLRIYHSWKYGCDARVMYDWVRHYYRSYKAETLGMTLEDFISLWRSFADTYSRPIVNWQSGIRLEIEQAVAYYIRARRQGLDDYEIRYVLFSHFDRAREYLSLRRKFNKEFVLELLFASQMEPWRLDIEYVIEARRRGASHKDILVSVRNHSTRELALTRRKSQREAREG